VVGFGNPLGRIIAQLRQLGFEGEILGGPEIAFADVLGTAKDAANGVKFLDLAFDTSSTEEPARSFVERYQKRYGRLPSAVSAVVYDGWSLILHAVEKSGSTEPEKIASELKRVASFPGVCGNLSVGDERDVVYPLVARVIDQGRPVPLKQGRRKADE
jgi:branched-chain amino acid transport system substrate-binding protein